MINAALVLEGGSMRSLYTSGVLDVFMENDMEFEYVIGVSAGALNAGNYIGKYIGRSARINLLHSNDKNFFGIKQLLLKGNAFNFDYVFYSPIKDLYPYDEKRLENTKQRYVVGATDCETGKAVYFEKYKYDELVRALQASSSIPLICKTVNVDGITCVDGAISDPICVHKAFSDGYSKVVVVLTRDIGYERRENPKLRKALFRKFYKKYPQLINTLNNLPGHYNLLTREICKMEEEKKLFVIRPSCEINIRKLERDARKLIDLYLQGRDDARKLLPQLSEYLKSS
jgi:predicted patatin/cPLA2 family phospholipase